MSGVSYRARRNVQFTSGKIILINKDRNLGMIDRYTYFFLQYPIREGRTWKSF